jgi:hypothetical protein
LQRHQWLVREDDTVVERTEYWQDPNTRSTVRDGTTSYAESLADLEGYVLPMDRLRASALHGWGVGDGLRVRATPGSRGVTIGTGTAFDAAGNQISLTAGGVVVVDPRVDPDQVVNVPTVVVGPDGATLDTAGSSGEQLVTITWREVLGTNDWVNAPALVHAPWLRLVPRDGFSDVGAQVVLARVTLGTDGTVTEGGLRIGLRRAVGVPAGRLELRAPRPGDGGPPLTVGLSPVAELAAQPDGDVVLSLLGGAQPRPALTIEHATGGTRVAGDLAVAGNARVDGTLTADDLTAARISGAGLTVQGPLQAGDVTAAAVSAARLTLTGPLHAEDVSAGVVHAASLSVGGPLAAGDVSAASFSGSSLSVTNLDAWDVTANGRLTAGSLTSGGIVEAFQYRTDGQSWLRGQVFTGPLFGHWEGPATLALSGSRIWDGADGWLQLQSSGGKTFARGNLTVEGESWLRGQVYTGAVFGHWDGASTLHLFGSRIWDGGDGWLQVQSGGGKTYMRGEVTVEGRLHKPGGGFRIDHPLAPEDKYLSHSFVESPEMVDLYSGVAVTDADGTATVALPDFFEALNRDHRFQLTPVGELALATVQGGVRDNSFTIRTDKPGVTVSWQVTGVRQDPWAEANRIPVEEEKPPPERGSLMHPELYGRPGAPAFLAAAVESPPAAPESLAAVPESRPAEPSPMTDEPGGGAA